ncbi:UDP-glucose 4-epimerase GalE [Salibacter halophilus]|uniref:UDP-glucose 4-epimerase n=1 Tax=Salibacter halophilus TaxID=1803916 RepID=A0A6N6M7R1_9FLAO|nr:UDP-glucose 4-epimerase GalE [Salibacter halophilus]KAB1066120.1 UDP-glucose 4-epimerase GalE [Salibacter halophilus]
MKKVLITGAAGYIGSHAVVDFHNAGYEVIGVDNYLNSEEGTYKRIAQITGKEIAHHNIDLRDKKAVFSLFKSEKDIDAVVHFAALKSVPDSVDNPIFCFDNNNNSTLNLADACSQFGVKHFIFSSSCSVYGNVTADQLPVTEETQLKRPESPYGYTKQNGEEMLHYFSDVKDVKIMALRYFNPVGAHPSGEIGELPAKRVNNLVPVITQSAAGVIDAFTVFGSDWKTRDGSCIRDYIHVSDIASAHTLAYEFLKKQDDEKFFDVINLGSGEGVSVFEAIKAFERATGVRAPYKVGDRRDGDVESIYSNPQKAKEVLGWEPKFDIEDMMASAWKWQQKLKELGMAVHKL